MKSDSDSSFSIIEVPSDREISREDAARSNVFVHNPDGSLPALFVTRSWVDDAEHFRLIAQRLGSEQPIYSIGPPDFDTLEQFPYSTDEWVDFLMLRIRAIGYQGAYTIMGWSFGGVLALELAERLVSEGEEVRRVVMIDTRLPKQRPETKPGSGRPVRLSRFARKLVAYCEFESRKERLEYAWLRLSPRRRFEKKKRRREAARLRSSGEDGSERKVATRWTGDRMTYLKRTVHVVYLKYQRHVTRVPVSLFRTEESFMKAKEDPTLGWWPYVRGPFTVDTIAGDHSSIFSIEHLDELMSSLARELRPWKPRPGRSMETSGPERRDYVSVGN